MTYTPIKEQIDQSNFQPTEYAHVFYDTVKEKYFFCDETTEAHGPYDTAKEAKNRLNVYIADLG